jgi:hypothetical protein
LAFLKNVCGVGIQEKTAESPESFGCTCCPPFAECVPKADGAIVKNPDHLFPIDPVARGHFTRAGAEQALVTLHGCGFSMNGGSIAVFERANGAWRLALHEDFMLVPGKCRPFRRADGRDLLVCRALSANQSHAFLRVMLGDFSKPEPKRWHELATLEDGSVSACWSEIGHPFVRSRLLETRFLDKNADGVLDLVLTTDTTRAVVNEAFLERCNAWTSWQDAPKKVGAEPDPWALLPEPAHRELTFLFDGIAFRAPPLSIDDRAGR